ncbi:glutathione S-transferase family protein [Gimibacter soli]|uniref:Glutathione S-transferase family protein n=1 Tax=Gimibacter soli TaxID=3024400 RepID=A0AAE9XNV9_9PROT|nr:glutathione S-transferase family protein [Gimibacter soli]WCL54488.1 glutathione S-transferase family protein [Gimibacter soli]
MPVLYHHWLSPAARFIRLMLAEKRIDFELRLEKDWERRPAFLQLNPAGEVPVLVLDNGATLAGTMAIAEYLEESVPSPTLLDGTAEERAEMRRLTGWFHTKLGTEVTRLTVQEKLNKRFLGMGEPDSEAIRCASHNLKIHMRYIGHLAERRHYLAGNRYSMADAAAVAHISVIDYFGDIVWEDWPEAKDWYMRVKGRRAVRTLLSDRVGGILPPKHYDQLDF